MEQIEIEELKRRAFIHDHTAQIQLGEYYLNKKFSNSNFSRAEKFLKMAAEKHQKQGMELLISLYLKYMEYYIKNNIQPGKVSMCFRLGVKWCKIGAESGFDFTKDQDKFVEIYANASENNSKIDLNYKYKKKFNKYFIITGVLMGLMAILIIVFASLKLNKAFWITPAILLIILCVVFFLIWTFKRRLINANSISNMVVSFADIDKINKKQEKANIPQNLSLVEKLKLIFDYENAERHNLTPIQRGLLGECYIEFLNGKKAKVLYSSIAQKLKKYNEELSSIEWINKGVETNDPFDFIVNTISGKKFYIDVKTNYNNLNKIYMSYLQKECASNAIKNGTTYFICKVNNFWYKNIDDFTKKAKFPAIGFYDLKEEADLSKLEITYH